MENEIEFTDEMKRATPADIFRIYRQLWGYRFPYTNQEQNMNIYKVYRTDAIGWDEYDSAVVVAENEQQARDLCPFEASDTDIVKAEIVDDKVAGVVVSSFNAG